MNKTVLLIDDSATIRRLVDSELTAEGYRTILAPNAEDGLKKAAQESPDLIILDHQLPGTTGYEVCCELLANPETAKIPVVASSTLRKKAYSEYIECDNVVDMLPKPYSPEVLKATVENAIETASLVVQSQSDGSAVPEVINELGESSLAGTFECFSLREVIDFINNGQKQGTLEITTPTFRACVFTDGGRIQAVTASGINLDTFLSRIPDDLSDLVPVMRLTVSGKKESELDGLLELLDNKVLDPRLLRKLLRFQATELLHMCFAGNPVSFRFHDGQQAPPLFRKLPLESSLVALLVHGSAADKTNQDVQGDDCQQGYVRKAIRGQCLDRSGLDVRHLQLMKLLAGPVNLQQIAEKLQWSTDEARQVLCGFEIADLVERTELLPQKLVYCVSSDAEFRRQFGEAMHPEDEELQLKIVSDLLALGLLMRRQKPNVVVIDEPDESTLKKVEQAKSKQCREWQDVLLVGINSADESASDTLLQSGFDFAYSKADSDLFHQLLDQEAGQQCQPESVPQPDSETQPVLANSANRNSMWSTETDNGAIQ